ncbi:asparaginase domain-containing protein, partial [Neisseria sp. P0015.S009]|uniref:asparaginase domain-containing protein n=1 Tax=Neisseria sp. P0015.S009 TaxID=3436765 RepID=UPI003F81F55D
LYTGGTIGLTQSSAGQRPHTDHVDKALAPFSDGLDFECHVCQPLIDSSAVMLQNQRDWLDLIIAKLPDYDGILVLQGTD